MRSRRNFSGSQFLRTRIHPIRASLLYAAFDGSSSARNTACRHRCARLCQLASCMICEIAFSILNHLKGLIFWKMSPALPFAVFVKGAIRQCDRRHPWKKPRFQNFWDKNMTTIIVMRRIINRRSIYSKPKLIQMSTSSFNTAAVSAVVTIAASAAFDWCWRLKIQRGGRPQIDYWTVCLLDHVWKSEGWFAVLFERWGLYFVMSHHPLSLSHNYSLMANSTWRQKPSLGFSAVSAHNVLNLCWRGL